MKGGSFALDSTLICNDSFVSSDTVAMLDSLALNGTLICVDSFSN